MALNLKTMSKVGEKIERFSAVSNCLSKDNGFCSI